MELKEHERKYINDNNADILNISETHILLKIQSEDGMYKLYELRYRGPKYLQYVSAHMDDLSAEKAWKSEAKAG